MKCQLNALEILAKDHMKITSKPYVGSRNIKDIFFKRRSLYLYCFGGNFKSSVNFIF